MYANLRDLFFHHMHKIAIINSAFTGKEILEI